MGVDPSHFFASTREAKNDSEVAPLLEKTPFKMKRVCAAILVFGFFCQLTAARTISESEDLETRELLEDLRDAIRMRERELEEQVEEEIKEVEEKKEEEEHLLAVRGAWDDFKASVKKAGKKIKNAFGRREEEEEKE